MGGVEGGGWRSRALSSEGSELLDCFSLRVQLHLRLVPAGEDEGAANVPQRLSWGVPVVRAASLLSGQDKRSEEHRTDRSCSPRDHRRS